MKIRFFLVFSVIFLSFTGFLIAGRQCKESLGVDKNHRCGKITQMPDKDKFGMEMECILQLSEQLNLSGEQVEKIRKLRDDSKKDISSTREEIKKSKVALHNELKKSKSDRDKINKLIDKISLNQKKMMVIRTEHMLAIKEILTPGQFKKLIDIFEKHKKDFKKKFMEKYKDNKN